MLRSLSSSLPASLPAEPDANRRAIRVRARACLARCVRADLWRRLRQSVLHEMRWSVETHRERRRGRDRLGLVGTVLSVDDCYATVELYDKCVVKVTKASICKVLRISLAVGTWVRIRTGHIGKISKLTDPVSSRSSGETI